MKVRRLARSVAAAAGAIACIAAAAAQQPVRDNAPIVAGTASISGTVFVDGASKQPARRARVTLTNLARTSPGQTTTTDERGAFFFGGLSAGRFELDAFKPGYLRGSYAPNAVVQIDPSWVRRRASSRWRWTGRCERTLYLRERRT